MYIILMMILIIVMIKAAAVLYIMVIVAESGLILIKCYFVNGFFAAVFFKLGSAAFFSPVCYC